MSLVRPQLIAIALLNVAIVWGLARLAFGMTGQGIPILIAVFWACYDITVLSVVLRAATYRPVEREGPTLPTERATTAEHYGRLGAGQA